MAEETHSALVNFLSDPATLVGLGVVAAGTAYYLSSRTTPFSPPVPLGNQTSEVPVSLSPHTHTLRANLYPESPVVAADTVCAFYPKLATY